MGISKVVRKNTGEVLVDLTNDTVTAETLADGMTAHDKNGEIITGKMSSGGDPSIEDAIVSGTITNYTNSRVTSIGSCAFYARTKLEKISLTNCTRLGISAFYACNSLTNIHFPKCVTIEGQTFNGCTVLEDADFPECTLIGAESFNRCQYLKSANFPKLSAIGLYGFYYCTALSSVNIPVCKNIGNYAFQYCAKLKSLDLPKCEQIGFGVFQNCSTLDTIRFGASKVCNIAQSAVFANTGIGSNTGSIFVPASLVNSYKAATNWAFYSNRIFGY